MGQKATSHLFIVLYIKLILFNAVAETKVACMEEIKHHQKN